jgi:hypothetical protein
MGVSIKDLVTSTVRVLGKPEYAEFGLPADDLMDEVESELQSHVTDFETWKTADDTGLGIAIRRLVCKEALETLGLATTVNNAKNEPGHICYRLTENGRLYFQDMAQL